MYKIILLDYSMPDLDGPQTARRISELFKENPILSSHQKPFICCCTAYTEAQYQRIAIESGMDKFISKPINNDEIKEILQNIE